MADREHIALQTWEHQGLRVIQCQTCGYCHQMPLPAQAEIDAYYAQNELYREGQPDWFKKTEAEYKAGLWHSAYRWQSRLLQGSLNYKPTVYDIGCGQADWMHYYMAQHGDAWGVEPSASARAVSLLPSRTLADLESLNHWLVHRATDSLRLALVLECVLDPLLFTMILRNGLVGTRGKIMVIVPNEFNPLQAKVAAREGHWYIQKPHLNYFSRASIRNLIESAGFKVTYAGGTFPMELFYLMGYKYIGNDILGRKLHRARLNFEQHAGQLAWRMYGLLYRQLGWGRESLIVAQKVHTKDD